MKSTGFTKKNSNKGLICSGNTWFPKKLIHWHHTLNRRQMPWKNEKDVYRIWLSEIILQQTRVEQGLSYYQSFIKAFPTIAQLASAKEEKVFKLWEGLGYYNRCRNLLETARDIVKNREGVFPSTYEDILTLKGIGPYTAAAIASFAFNLPYAVVDGNVYRVISRVFGINTAIDSAEGKKLFHNCAQALLDTGRPAIYNQAIMDFGATVCKPVGPECQGCPFQKKCVAFQTGRVQEFPVKGKKSTMGSRWIYYFILIHNGKVYLRKRDEKDIWRGLYEFIRYENGAELSRNKLVSPAFLKQFFDPGEAKVEKVSGVYRQQLSHVKINGRFVILTAQGKKPGIKDYIQVPLARLSGYPFPKFILSFLEEKNVNLTRYRNRLNELDK